MVDYPEDRYEKAIKLIKKVSEQNDGSNLVHRLKQAGLLYLKAKESVFKESHFVEESHKDFLPHVRSRYEELRRCYYDVRNFVSEKSNVMASTLLIDDKDYIVGIIDRMVGPPKINLEEHVEHAYSEIQSFFSKGYGIILFSQFNNDCHIYTMAKANMFGPPGEEEHPSVKKLYDRLFSTYSQLKASIVSNSPGAGQYFHDEKAFVTSIAEKIADYMRKK